MWFKIIMKVPKEKPLDETDLRIIEILALEGRKNSYEISKGGNGKYSLSLKYNSVLRRIKRLERDGYVREVGERLGKKNVKTKVHEVTLFGLAKLLLLRQELWSFVDLIFEKNKDLENVVIANWDYIKANFPKEVNSALPTALLQIFSFPSKPLFLSLFKNLYSEDDFYATIEEQFRIWFLFTLVEPYLSSEEGLRELATKISKNPKLKKDFLTFLENEMKSCERTIAYARRLSQLRSLLLPR
jgi:DNA-binding Lrp family transcriptional regulator